ncbi:MAG: VanZ family protein [Longimicrobiales bacterium]
MAHRRGRRLSRLISFLPALVWAAAVLSIGSLHSVPHLETPLPADKVAHFGMYGILGLLAAVGWRRNGRTPAALLVVLLAISVGVADELHQRSIPERSAEIADLVADIAGVCIGFAAVARYKTAPRTGTE